MFAPTALRATPVEARPLPQAASLPQERSRGDWPAPVVEATGDLRQRIADALQCVKDRVEVTRRLVHAGERVVQVGEAFTHLYILNSGCLKLVTYSHDGREQVVGLKFRGDWVGFSAIASGRYLSDAVAMDTGEVWVVRYDSMIAACATAPALLAVMHEAMSREIADDRDALMSVCTLKADARVANFLRYWADAMDARGLRTDQITLRMSRAEIGNFLGLTLESVSRAMSRMAREQVINFSGSGPRDVCIPDRLALSTFIQRCLGTPAATPVQ